MEQREVTAAPPVTSRWDCVAIRTAVLKGNRTIMLSLAILLAVSTLLVSIYLLYRKKNNMYH